MVGRDLEEITGRFDCHRGEINCLKIREKDAKEETKKLKGFIIGAGHEAQVFKDHLDRMEENVCKFGQTPSEVGEEFVSSEDEGRMKFSYASAAGEEYVAPPVENSIPLPVPAPQTCCLGPTTTLPPMEEITEEPVFCQEIGLIGLVAIMFFFELLFSYVSSSISFYVPLANLFSIILFPYLLITRDTQNKGEARF